MVRNVRIEGGVGNGVDAIETRPSSLPDFASFSAESAGSARSRHNVTRTGFPRPDGQSLSYWLQQVRCDELLDYRSAERLPENVDCVVIGSGITGCLAAKSYRERWPSRSVAILEARDFCSGATGRNAGHCKPDQWRGFAKYEREFGTEQALKILKNEQATWEALVAYVRENDVDCDLWVGDTLDVPMTPELASEAGKNFDRFKAAGGKVDHIKVTTDPREARKVSRLKGAQACYAWPASTLQPRKLTAHIMRENLKMGIGLHTYTVVHSVAPSENASSAWTVNACRGAINCTTVIHATNAYTAAHEPIFQSILRPTPHMCNKVIPPLSFSGSKALQNSYGVLLPNGALISINPRCTTDGVVMFGGTNPGQKKLNEWVSRHPEYCVDDSFANVKPVTDEVRRFADAQFDGWDDGRVMGPGQGYDYSWSGIIGLTGDGLPFVGEIPGKKGQWACVGHNGHGMARTFTAAPGLVKLMAGESWESTGLPEVYQLSVERIDHLRRMAPDGGNAALLQ